MAKLPDFSELTKKFDIQGLVDSVKSAVSGAPQKAPEGDEVAARFVEAINMVQNLATAHAEEAKMIAAIHTKLNALYKDTQLIKEAATLEKKETTAVEDSHKEHPPTEKSEQ
jgi:hypothetical protein